MNYKKHYDLLIDRAKHRTLTDYVERHHVIPRCMGGNDDSGNIVRLTPEEHYVVHQLLAKIYPGINGLVLASIRMARQCTGRRAYGWLRRRYAAWRKGRKESPESKAKRAASKAGYKHSEETKRRIGDAHLRLGTKPQLTPEQRKLIGLKMRGIKRNPFTAEHRAKIGASSKGRKFSDEYRANMSAIVKARVYTPEQKAEKSAKLSAAKKGVKRAPFTRRPPSEETRKKISEAHKRFHLRKAEIMPHKTASESPAIPSLGH